MSSAEKIKWLVDKHCLAVCKSEFNLANALEQEFEAAIDELQAAHDAQAAEIERLKKHAVILANTEMYAERQRNAAEIERLQQALGECEGALATHRHPLEDAEHAAMWRALVANMTPRKDVHFEVAKCWYEPGARPRTDNRWTTRLTPGEMDTAIRAAMKGGE